VKSIKEKQMDSIKHKRRITAILLALAVLFIFAGCKAATGNISITTLPAPAPEERLPSLIYKKDGSVYLTNGIKTACLGDPQLIEGDAEYGDYLNSILAADGRILYYLNGVDAVAGGELMGVDISVLEPESLAEGVFAAEVSNDGEQVLYIKNLADGFGDLYVLKPGAVGKDFRKRICAKR
jgi:hypothetical protein